MAMGNLVLDDTCRRALLAQAPTHQLQPQLKGHTRARRLDRLLDHCMPPLCPPLLDARLVMAVYLITLHSLIYLLTYNLICRLGTC